MERELKRNEQEGMIGGVCAGLGEYLGIDKVWVRLIFVLSIFFSAIGIGIAGPIAYIIMWIVVPRKPLVFPNFENAYHQQNATEKHFHVGGDELFQQLKNKKNHERSTVGLILLFIGFFLLIIQLDFLQWNDLIKFWPSIFILIGLFTIFTSFKYTKQQHYNGKNEEEEKVENGSDYTVHENQDEHNNH